MEKLILAFITLSALISADLLHPATAIPTNSSYRQWPVGVKIVGGSIAPLGSVPHQASLMLSGTNGHGGDAPFCGGSIISDSYILTAAHCLPDDDDDDDGFPLSRLVARTGFNSMSRPETGHQTVQVSKIIIHKNYNLNTHVNDIALLKLAKPLVLSDASRTRAIRLPSRGYAATGTVLATGWGTIQEGGPASNELRTVFVDVITDFECRKSYGNKVVSSMLCARYPGGGKDACQGDSGGPLVEKSSGVLVGIVSWGVGCARAEYPGVYTKVSYFIDWILENAK